MHFQGPVKCHRCERAFPADGTAHWVVLEAREDGWLLVVCPDCQMESERQIAAAVAVDPRSDERVVVRVEGLPPLKSGSSSMWRKPVQMERLKALRQALLSELAGATPFDEPITLTVRICALASHDDPGVFLRRAHGDLDNLIGGVCDGIQAAHPDGFDASAWLDVPEAARPARPLGVTDDSWIRRLDARVLLMEGPSPHYELELAPFGG